MVVSTSLGYPPIGRARETKFAVEKFLKGEITEVQLKIEADKVRDQIYLAHKDAGIDLIPGNQFTYYDFMFDLSLTFGMLPDAVVKGDMKAYFASAKSWDMTRWFTTNYYILPPIFEGKPFALARNLALEDFEYHKKKFSAKIKPVIVGPLSFVLAGKNKSKKTTEALVMEVAAVYQTLIAQLEKAGCVDVQIDEPMALKFPEHMGLLEKALVALRPSNSKIRIHLATYFDDAGEHVEKLMKMPADVVCFDVIEGRNALRKLRDGKLVPKGKKVGVGAIHGRNIWRANLHEAVKETRKVADSIGTENVYVHSSCSLQYVPHTLSAEPRMKSEIRQLMAFSDEKLKEIAVVAKGVNKGDAAIRTELAAEEKHIATLRDIVYDAKVANRMKALTEKEFTRPPFTERQKAQKKALNLPPLFTSTIGSFPQTQEIRKARADYKKAKTDLDAGKITKDAFAKAEAAYKTFIKSEIKKVIELQEKIGIDVLVHGEPERSDMVEYFAEQLKGVVTSENGWVKSYGTRCVRPPIIYGDVSRPTPMTVEWITYAQSLTKKPVKGMLTAPTTIYNWSFTRVDIPLSESVNQIALALRDEIADLEKAGIKIIQVDEPALIERMPPHEPAKTKYLEDVVRAFRLATAGVTAATQIVTHMCYGNFGEIYPKLLEMEADVFTFELTKSGHDLYPQFTNPIFTRGIGVGIFDVHNPKVDAKETIKNRIKEATSKFPLELISIVPDCGLKTRGYEETVPMLTNMVEAVKDVRKTL
ncbi:Methionine synthase [uncultured archaeon]|nr:Methionine synthase [uncultured archaeon]